MTAVAEVRVLSRTVEQHWFSCGVCNEIGEAFTMPSRADHAGWLHAAHKHGTALTHDVSRSTAKGERIAECVCGWFNSDSGPIGRTRIEVAADAHEARRSAVRRTDELQPGDLVRVTPRVTRQVERVEQTDVESRKGERLMYVHYIGGRTDEWSGANSANPSSLWEVTA